MAHPKAVHRPLSLSTPIEQGPDVRALQGQINERYRDFKIDRQIEQDGDFGKQSFDAAEEIAICLGVCDDAQDKLNRGTVSEGTQALIRGRKRTAEEEVAGRRREDYRKELRRRYAKEPGEEAVAKGRKLIGTKEQPEGSNWGGKVEEFIRFTGYEFPVYWCGCFACWVVCKLGGAKVPERIRLGYAPHITADALAGRNGLTAIPASKARPGDIACLWGGQHIEVVAERPSGGSVRCLGGNTSKGGQESNGGEVAENTRSLSDFDRGIVARPNWG
jgi:hypothetical protein